MRAELLVIGLAAALAGCASMRPRPAPALPPLAAPTVEVPVADDTEQRSVPAPGFSRHLACLPHPEIDAWEQRLRMDRGHWAPSVHGPTRGGRHLARARSLFLAAGLPPSLALLPVIESGFRPHARSRDGGAGLWQFQRATARRFGLEVSRRRDQRLDPERSTRAAIRYLAMLHARYDDWMLALAAYNAGEGRVDRALKRRPGATVWELAAHQHLPSRTADYVGRFLAVVRLVEADEARCRAGLNTSAS
jgi:hypothetical protein